MAQTSAMLTPPIFELRAGSARRVPSQSGQVVKVMARSTKARMWGCIASGSFDSIDFWIFGMIPSKVTLMPSALILVGSWYSRCWSSFLVYFPSFLSMSKKPEPSKMRPYQPSIE